MPKLKLVGFAVRLPAATAVAESVIFSGLLAPLLVSAKFPLTLPADCGLKTTLKVVLCPGAKVTGRVKPVVLKPVPVTLACVMVRLVPPVLLSVSD